MARRWRRQRRNKRQRELLEMAGWFRGCGLVGIVGAAVLVAAGGSATLAWYVGAVSAWMLGLGLLLPLAARVERVTWKVAAGVVLFAFVGGAVYLAAPSDATWWLGPLTTLPAVALAMYFSEPTGRRGESNQRPWTPPGGG